eukprot:scaffold136576_cov31-Tisochrysis_lutea.AAC.2
MGGACEGCEARCPRLNLSEEKLGSADGLEHEGARRPPPRVPIVQCGWKCPTNVPKAYLGCALGALSRLRLPGFPII